MDDIRITETNQQLVVVSPYHPEFPGRAGNLMGRWDSDRHVWTFPERYRDNVVEILDDLFGYSESATDTVLVRLTVGGSALEAKRDSVRAAGREVARATGRDSGARLGPSVALMEGRVGSGGSRQNWRTVVAAHSDLQMELPRSAAERLVSNPAPWSSAEIIGEIATRPDPAELRARRAALENEIREIDHLLAAGEPLSSESAP